MFLWCLLTSTSPISVLRTEEVVNPLMSGTFYQYPQFFALNFVYLCWFGLWEFPVLCWLMWIKEVVWEIVFRNHLLLSLVCLFIFLFCFDLGCLVLLSLQQQL